MLRPRVICVANLDQKALAQQIRGDGDQRGQLKPGETLLRLKLVPKHWHRENHEFRLLLPALPAESATLLALRSEPQFFYFLVKD